MTNVVVEYSKRIRLCNFDKCESIEHGIARVGRGYYKYSAPETIIAPRKSTHHEIKYRENVDCFAVGVMPWKFVTGIHTFADTEKDSNSPIADLNVLYDHRKRCKLNEVGVQFSEGDPNANIVKPMRKILDIQLEDCPEQICSLSFSIALQLPDEKTDQRLKKYSRNSFQKRTSSVAKCGRIW
jgi:hypothetical protein